MRLRVATRNLPILVGYVILPLLGVGLHLTEAIDPKRIYDAIWMIGAATIPLIGIGLHIKLPRVSRYYFLIAICALFGLAIKCVFVPPDQVFRSYFQLMPFLMEIKPLCYFVFAGAWIWVFGKPTAYSYEHAGIALAFIIIFAFCVESLVAHAVVRPATADESNYDNFLILLALLAHLRRRDLRLDRTLLLFLVATLLSQSKTGIGCFLVITMVYAVKAKQFKYWFAGAVAVPAMYAVVAYRLDEVAGGFARNDRLRMYRSFLLHFSHDFSWLHKLFGNFPGYPIAFYDPYIEWFIKYQVVDVLHGTGLQAFNYHAMWLRLLVTWGVVPVFMAVIFVGWTLMRPRRGGRMIGKCSVLAFVFLVLLQGATMGVIYLSTIGVLTILYITTLSVKDTGSKYT